MSPTYGVSSWWSKLFWANPETQEILFGTLNGVHDCPWVPVVCTGWLIDGNKRVRARVYWCRIIMRLFLFLWVKMQPYQQPSVDQSVSWPFVVEWWRVEEGSGAFPSNGVGKRLAHIVLFMNVCEKPVRGWSTGPAFEAPPDFQRTAGTTVWATTLKSSTGKQPTS